MARPAATVVLRRGALVLLLERSMTMSFAPGMNVFPGGGVSEDDLASADPLLACAIRETKEEVDIAVPMCHLFDRWVTPEVEDQRFDVSFFVANTEDVGRLTTTEAVAMRWIDPAEALDSHRDGLLPMLRWAVGRRARGNQRRACLRSRRARSGRVGRITDDVGVVR